jgi:hypothetical protein
MEGSEGQMGTVKVFGTSWWRGPRDRGTSPQCNLGGLRGGARRGQARHPSCELETPSQPARLFWKQRPFRPISRPCRPVSRCGPKRSRWLALGLPLPDRGADPCSPPPHQDASNLIWHWHCRLGRRGGDCLNATTTTPTFLCSIHAMAGVHVAHPPFHLLPGSRIRPDQSPCPAILPADHAPKPISFRALPSSALDKGAPWRRCVA